MNTEKNKISKAWLLEYDVGKFIAINIQSMQELVVDPEIVKLPFTPKHCQYLFRWNGRIIPVMDLKRLLSNETTEKNKILIVTFRHQNELLYGSLFLSKQPRIVEVSDELYCALPKKPRILSNIAISCFSLEKKLVPIIDLGALFLKSDLSDSQKNCVNS